MAVKQLPKLTLLTRGDTSSGDSDSSRRTSAFDLVSLSDLPSTDRQTVERLVDSVCRKGTIVAVARTPRRWDLRPVLAVPGENEPSIVRTLSRDITGAVHLQARLRETFDRLNLFSDLQSAVIDWGFSDGTLWYRRPLFETTLAHSLADNNGLNEEQTFIMASRLANTVAAWHERGVIHGHINSSNIVIDSGNKVNLLDPAIGLVLIQALKAGAEYEIASFAPEVAQAQTVAYSSDIFGLGLVFRRLFVSLSRQHEMEPSRGRFETRLQPYVDLASAMLDRDPLRRPTLEEIRSQFTGTIKPQLEKERKGKGVVIINKPDSQNKPQPPLSSNQPPAAEEVVSGTQINRAHSGKVASLQPRNAPPSFKLGEKRPGGGNQEAFIKPPAQNNQNNRADSANLQNTGGRNNERQQPRQAPNLEKGRQENQDRRNQNSSGNRGAGFIGNDSVSNPLEPIEVFRNEKVFSGASINIEQPPRYEQPSQGIQLIKEPQTFMPQQPSLYGPQFGNAQQFNPPQGTPPVGAQPQAPLFIGGQYSPPQPFVQQQQAPQQFPQGISYGQQSQAMGNQFGQPQNAPFAPQQGYSGPAYTSPGLTGFSSQQSAQGNVQQPFIGGVYQPPEMMQPPLPQAAYLPVKNKRSGSSFFFPIVMLLAITGFSFWLYNSGRIYNLPLVGDWLSGNSYRTEPWTLEDLREAWQSGIPSQMLGVAEAALDKENPNRQAGAIIIQSTRAGENTPEVAGVNAPFLRVAFDSAWERDLTPIDRRVALSLGLAGLLRDRMPKDLEGIGKLHPGVVLALTANAGKSVSEILGNIPASVLAELPPPFGPAFAVLAGGGPNVSCSDPGVQQLAKLSTRGVESAEDIVTFLSADGEKRLRALSQMFSHNNSLAKPLLDVLLKHPNIKIEMPVVAWAKEADLANWKELESGDQLIVLGGLPPYGLLMTDHLLKLLAHPVGSLRGFAISKVLDQVAFKHPVAYETLKKIRDKPTLLLPNDTKELAMMLQSPADVSVDRIQAWLANNPPVTLVAGILLGTHAEKQATNFDAAIAMYLTAQKWKPDVISLRQLSTHPDRYTRLFAYNELYLMTDHETARELLLSAERRETDQELLQQLGQMLLDIGRK